MTKNKVALVTGGAGFIGSVLARRMLENGFLVHLLTRPSTDLWRLNDLKDRLTVHAIDVLDLAAVKELFRALRPQYVFHLALPLKHPHSSTERHEQLSISVMGTFAVLEALRLYTPDASLVHVSSSLEYVSAESALSENSEIAPSTFRGAAKASATLLCRQAAAEFDLNLKILRPFSVYGPWEQPNRFIPTLLQAAYSHKPVSLTSNQVMHDFIFVEDVVNMLLSLAEKKEGGGEIFNCGTGRQTSNHGLCKIVEAVTGCSIEVINYNYPLSPCDTTIRIADVEKCMNKSGWKPAIALEEGIAVSWRWLNNRQGNWVNR